MDHHAPPAIAISTAFLVPPFQEGARSSPILSAAGLGFAESYAASPQFIAGLACEEAHRKRTSSLKFIHSSLYSNEEVREAE